MGWGLDVHWAALAREHGWRCGDRRRRLDPPPRRARGRRVRPRGGGRRGTLVPGRAPLPERARGRAHADDPPRLVSTAPQRSRGSRSWPSSTRAGATPCSECGRTARRSPRATPARRCACSCCTVSCRPGPRSRPARAARRRALAGLVREPRTQTRDGLQVTYVPYVSPPRERSYAAWGAWAAPALGAGAAPARALVPVRADPRPQRRARRRRGAPGAAWRAPLVVSVHGGDVLYTARRGPPGASAVARRARLPQRSCSPTARASPSSPARTAPARRASCTSAPTCPPRETARAVTVATPRDGRRRHGRSAYPRPTH